MQERGALSRLAFGAAIALIIGIGAVAVVAVSALVGGDAGVRQTPAVEEPATRDAPEQPEPSGPPEDPQEDEALEGDAEEDDAAQDDAVVGAEGGAEGPETETALVRLLGDEIEFRGAIRSAEGTRYVGGVTPARYVVPVIETGAVRASFQKQGEPGTLTVQIVSGDEVVAEDEISPSLGRVSISWEPDEE
jgi:hypothetical protein